METAILFDGAILILIAAVFAWVNAKNAMEFFVAFAFIFVLGCIGIAGFFINTEWIFG